jgi:hypothetical protein
MVRVPEADGTLFPMPSQLKPELAILMADIFPTGYAIGRTVNSQVVRGNQCSERFDI